jgi:hypothetical protein
LKIGNLNIPYATLLTVPYACYVIGITLNVLALALNQNQMPVLGPGGCSPAVADTIHACMTHATHLKILSDWIYWPQDGGIAFASIGDVFITAYEKTFDLALAAWLALVLRDYSE